MNKRRVGSLLALLCLCAFATPAIAQEEAGGEQEDLFAEEFELLEEERVYTASRHEQPISDSPATITVIDRERIENTHCTNVSCLLRQVPEIEVRRMGPGFHSVGARALASEANDKVLLLIDGREDNFESMGMPFWCLLALHLDDIERIEVVRGPGSALYGANAHSLVVNIITRRAKKNLAEAFVGAGEFGRQSIGARAHGKLGDWSLAVSAGREAADSFLERGTTLRDNVWFALRSDTTLGEGSISADLSYLRGQDELSTNLGRIMLRPVHIVRSMVQYRDDMLRAHLWYQMFYSSQSMDMPLVYNGIRMGSLPEIMNLANHSTDVELQFTHSFFEGNTLVAGANYRWLGMFWPDNDPPSVYQHRAGLFVQDEQRIWDQLLLLGAVRLDYNSITPFTVSPRAGLVWKPAKNQALRFHFGRAFRKPSFVNTSIHIKTTIPSPGFEGVVDFVRNSIGNENLDNERVTSFEIGYRGAVLEGRLELDADAFFNMYRNAISFQSRIVEDNLGLPDFENSWLRFENEGIDVDTIGGSVALEWKPAKWLSARANYTFRHSRYVNVVYIPTKKKGDRVSWEPAHLFNLLVDLKFENGLRAGAALFARSGIEDFWPEDGGFFADKVRVVEPARVLASGYLSWRISAGDWWVEPGVRVFNAAGGRWRDGTNIRRFDGKIIGDQWMKRLLLLFVRVGWEPER